MEKENAEIMKAIFEFREMNIATNGDRIRAMSDEELAFYVVNHPKWSDESACLEWLKEEVNDDSD